MKQTLFFLGALLGLLGALLFADRQPAKPDKPQTGFDWNVRLHLSDLDKDLADYFVTELNSLYSDQLGDGNAYITIWRES